MARFLKIILLAVLVSLAGCVNMNRIRVTSVHVDSITPVGFRAVSVAASVSLSNGSAGFSVYDVEGTVKNRSREIGEFAFEPVEVRARTSGTYSVTGQLSLSQGVSVLDLLSMAQNMDMDDFTMDISLKVKAKGGAPRKFAIKDIPVRDVINIMKTRTV